VVPDLDIRNRGIGNVADLTTRTQDLALTVCGAAYDVNSVGLREIYEAAVVTYNRPLRGTVRGG